MKHRYIIYHGTAGNVIVYSGPFRSLAAAEAGLQASLAAGKPGYIVDEWVGPCDRCKEHIVVSAGYYQHGCGEVYTYSPTV